MNSKSLILNTLCNNNVKFSLVMIFTNLSMEHIEIIVFIRSINYNLNEMQNNCLYHYNKKYL